jgi:hypothetical protein
VAGSIGHHSGVACALPKAVEWATPLRSCICTQNSVPRAVTISRLVVQPLLLAEGKRAEEPTAGLVLAEAAVGIADPGPSPAARWKNSSGIVNVNRPQGELLEIVLALGPAGPFAGPLHRRQPAYLVVAGRQLPGFAGRPGRPLSSRSQTQKQPRSNPEARPQKKPP